MKYDELSRKQKQLLASQYPYRSDSQLFSHSESTRKFFSKKQELMEFKEQAAEQDVSLQKRRDFVTGSLTDPNEKETISLIDTILGDFGEDAYRAALEIASHEVDPLSIVKDLMGVQAIRLRRGMQYELDADLGLNQDTEAAMSNFINLVRLNNDIVNGQKLDVQVDGSLSSLIMGMALDDDTIEVDAEIKDSDEDDE